jgi:hypothetical protein
MKLVCPACGAVASAEAWAADAHMRQTLAILAAIPAPVAERALYYIALFRPRGGRGLSWARAEKLAGELRDLVCAGHVQWEREAARPCPPRIWAEAIDTVRHRPALRLPLENHNYLRRVAYDLADRQDRAAETARNAAERDGSARRSDRSDTSDRPDTAASVLTPEQIREMVAGIKSKIGRRGP